MLRKFSLLNMMINQVPDCGREILNQLIRGYPKGSLKNRNDILRKYFA